MLPRALALLCLLAAPLAAQENLFGHQPDPKSKTRIEAEALFSRPAPGGFLPVRITITNANEAEGSIELRCTSSDSDFRGQGSEMTSSFKLSAPAGKTTQQDVLVPCNTLLNYSSGSNGTINVVVNMSGSFGSSTGNLSGNYQESQAALLISSTLFSPNASMLDSEVQKRIHGYSGSFTFAGKFDPGKMPEDWRAFSGYDGVALTDTDWKTLSPGARTAILRWNRLGGRLVILAGSANSDLGTLGISTSGAGLRGENRSFGSVVIDRLDSPTATLDVAGANALIDRFSNKDDNLDPVNHAILDNFSKKWALHEDFDPKSYNYGLFIVILIAFGILVGPVNLFVFAKSGRRHRLFITTPLIALATSVLLVALIILIDGFGGRGIRVALMEVRPDDGENSAYIYQEQVSRTGVLLGSSFTLNEPAAITPVPLSSQSQWSRLTPDNNGGGMRFESNSGDGKLEVEGDWFQSRSEQGQYLRAVVPTRGRLELRNGSGSPPSLVSTFDFKVDKLYYTDSSGTIWFGEGIEPGKPFTCREVPVTELRSFEAYAGTKLSVRSKQALAKLSPDPDKRGNRRFIAVTESAPGLETFKGITWTRTSTIITGPIATP
ncbi:hypothetical protein [Haloferula sp. BvORR071]|uniref:hypothetical protein n=1 Tax=Haloferula sp. BvORR071 TaxID=1396141 RepID=UPI000558DF00|nr:hypothetical protein [Haloferula sp. BvORR071]